VVVDVLEDKDALEEEDKDALEEEDKEEDKDKEEDNVVALLVLILWDHHPQMFRLELVTLKFK
jgi:hypothetical protein